MAVYIGSFGLLLLGFLTSLSFFFILYVRFYSLLQILMSINEEKANVHLICTSPIVISILFLRFLQKL